MTIILFLIVLAVLIFVHELGHFLSAKKMGIRVDEFALGFPPRIFGKKIGETVYTLNAIPFGGFVKIFGENPDAESIQGPDKERSFVHKPAWQQAIVLSAGVIFNFIFAWILICSAFIVGVTASYQDYPEHTAHMTEPELMVISVLPDSPAHTVGIKAGDVIHTIVVEGQNSPNGNGGGKVVQDVPLLTPEYVQNIVKTSEGKPLSIVYNCEKLEGDYPDCTRVTVVPTKNLVKDTYAIGISMDTVATMSLPWYQAIIEGTVFSGHLIWNTFTGFISFIGSLFAGTAEFSQISGPVGIAGLVGDASKLGFTYLLMFTAMISINLGVINLMPFPALDGGRLLFVLIESITRKKIKPVVANTINTLGFILLLTLMVVVTYGDIARLW